MTDTNITVVHDLDSGRVTEFESCGDPNCTETHHDESCVDDDCPGCTFRWIDPVTDHFGVCPECGKTDGYINVGMGHWFFCKEHRTRWLVGSNLFSSWRHETEDEQRAQYDALDFGSFRDVRPFHPKADPF